MTTFTESTVELAALDWLAQVGYTTCSSNSLG
jgi:hypothetical protein